MNNQQNPTHQPSPLPSAPGPQWKSLFIGLITLLVVAGGYILAAKQFSLWPYQVATESVSPTPSTSPDAMSDWKTYTNTQYGFELKYPATSTTELEPILSGKFKVLVNYTGGGGFEPLRLEISTQADSPVRAQPKHTSTFTGDNSAGTAYEGENPIYFTLGNKTIYANCINYQGSSTIINFCNSVLSTFKFTK